MRFPEPSPALKMSPTCDPIGILGPAAVLAGAMSATMIIKIIVGDLPEAAWETWDMWTGERACIGVDELKKSGKSECPICRAG